jgi:hypothetical protein
MRSGICGQIGLDRRVLARTHRKAEFGKGEEGKREERDVDG